VQFVDGSPTFFYRQPEIWQATTRLMLTQTGFPHGRAAPAVPGEEGGVLSDPGRLSSLASYYAQLASADAVQLRVLARTTETAGLTAVPVIDPSTEEPAPFVDILGLADTPLAAARISGRGANVFIRHVSQLQAQARIPAQDRILLQIVKEPLAFQGPELVQPRKKTTPAFVFLAVLTATFGLIFVVENARGRRGPAGLAGTPDEGRTVAMHEQRKGAVSGRA
jgi:hypothetical protein